MPRHRRHVAELPAWIATRVAGNRAGAVLAAQEAVVGLLDPGLSDAVALRDTRVAPLLELILGDLADRAEDVRGGRLVRIRAQPDLVDRHARKRAGVFGEV